MKNECKIRVREWIEKLVDVQPVVEPGEGSLALAHHLLLHAARVDDILEVKCELSITRVGGRKGRHAATFTHRQLLHRVAKC